MYPYPFDWHQRGYIVHLPILWLFLRMRLGVLVQTPDQILNIFWTGSKIHLQALFYWSRNKSSIPGFHFEKYGKVMGETKRLSKSRDGWSTAFVTVHLKHVHLCLGYSGADTHLLLWSKPWQLFTWDKPFLFYWQGTPTTFINYHFKFCTNAAIEVTFPLQKFNGQGKSKGK